MKSNYSIGIGVGARIVGILIGYGWWGQALPVSRPFSTKSLPPPVPA